MLLQGNNQQRSVLYEIRQEAVSFLQTVHPKVFHFTQLHFFFFHFIKEQMSYFLCVYIYTVGPSPVSLKVNKTKITSCIS